MRITRGEANWLARRRSGLSQEEWAVRAGMSVDLLRAIERDRSMSASIPPSFAAYTKKSGWHDLSPGELSTLCRRRKDWHADALADRLNVSLTTFRRMERDRARTAGRLAAWWLRRGIPRARAAAPVAVRLPSKTACRSTEDRGGRRRSPAP